MKSWVLGLALLLTLAACGGDSGGAGDVIEGQDVVVEMYDNRFEYTEIRIPVGGTVNWVGAGANAHNAMDANEAWSTADVWGDLDQFEGDEAKLTYDTPGEYVFFCSYHGNGKGDGMAGKLIVGGG